MRSLKFDVKNIQASSAAAASKAPPTDPPAKGADSSQVRTNSTPPSSRSQQVAAVDSVGLASETCLSESWRPERCDAEGQSVQGHLPGQLGAVSMQTSMTGQPGGIVCRLFVSRRSARLRLQSRRKAAERRTPVR